MSPWAPQRPCPHPGCPELLEVGQRRCATHEAEASRAVDQTRGTTAQRQYGAHHRRWRLRILARDPVCRDPYGRHADRAVPSTVADHVVPLARGGTWAETNGQGLCAPCHNRKRATEDKGPDGRAGSAPRAPENHAK